MNKVFLGGVRNGDNWRDRLIPLLSVEYYNPEAEDDTERGELEKAKQKRECDFRLYVITMDVKGLYWVAEVVDDSNKKPDKTILCILEGTEGSFIHGHLCRSIWSVADLVKDNGAAVFTRLEQVAAYLQLRTSSKYYRELSFDSGETCLGNPSSISYAVAKVNVPSGSINKEGLRIDPESYWCRRGLP